MLIDILQRYPIFDLAVVLSMTAVSGFQLLQKSASHHGSIDDLLDCKITPLFFDFIKYLPFCRIACLCVDLGLAANLTHW